MLTKSHVKNTRYFFKSPAFCTCTRDRAHSRPCRTAAPGAVGPAKPELYEYSVEFWLYDSL